jgi:hypothetical protein
MVVPSASTLDTLARLPPVPASAPLSCYVIFNSKSLFGAVLFLNWEDCRFYVMQDGCTDRSRFDSISLALESISRFKKPGVEAVAVRQCSELYGPAIFLSEDDCSFFLVPKAGEPLVVYQKFKYLSDAVKFITDEYISDGTDEDDKEDDDDDDDDEDDDVLLIELKEHDVGRKKFAAVHSKMPTDIDEEDDDELEEDDHLTTTPIDLGANKEQNKELEAENKVPTQMMLRMVAMVVTRKNMATTSTRRTLMSMEAMAVTTMVTISTVMTTTTTTMTTTKVMKTTFQQKTLTTTN